ncbi:MAG: right-handed parallel beta-helix repeat-containing protein [Chloroflexi bacterium]|nr:MAG: right-handed parallel beta-helix repeat-containing protein [Chloroflexota bacterium]
MFKKLNRFTLLLVIVAVAMTSAVRVTPVYADDGGTEPVTEESAAPPAGEEASPDEGSAPQEPASAPESPQQESAAEEPAPEAAEPPAAETPEVTETEPAEDAPTVAEVLEQLPEVTELAVINDEGEIEPLATMEAAEIVQSGDPRYTVSGTTYYFMPIGGCGVLPNCTEAAAPIQTAIDYLNGTNSGSLWAGVGATPDDGTIYIDAGNYTENVTVDGNSWSGTSRPTALTLSGAGSATTILNGSLSIANMNIFTVSGLSITGANATTGVLTVSNNSGLLALSDVSATNSAGDGARLTSAGDVDIADSKFNENAGNGLIVSSGGNIQLDTVSANDNRLTGASLDTCLYGTVDPGVCAGSGAVTITGSSTAPYSNQFDHNGFNPDGSGNLAYGLIVDSGGSIAIDHVQANLNSIGGAVLRNTDGVGNVTIDQSDFSLNPNGTGLYVFTAGNLNVTSMDALGNSMGAQLYNYGNGATNISNSNFGTTPANGNTATGLHVEAGGPVTLNTVTASYNGANGGYIISQGDITVSSSAFNANVQGNYPDDPGLRAISFNGNITLNNVVADENVYGPGAALDTYGVGTITITGGVFNQNGTFGIQAYSDDGDITLDNVIASYNGVKGAYLGAFWAGNIRVYNSIFVENGLYGIYAFTNEGNISLELVTVSGSDGAPGPLADDLTDYGAILEAGGDVTVINSTFQLNTDVGLGIVSGGQVNLSNVVADSNGGNGVEVYSITTAGPICSGEQPVNIVVTVDGTAYTNNGGYGLMVKPGPEGTLVFVNPATFGGNALGDYLIDLSQDFKDCTPEPKEEEPCDDDKGPLIVEVPPTGGPTVAQDCDQYTGTILKLPDGTSVKIGCPFEGFSHLEEVLEENLPTPIGAGIDFLAGLSLGLTDGQGNLILNEDGTVTINFAIPEGARAGHHSILFWDETLNDGKGGWVELPPYEVGTSFALHSDDPDDPRTIISGVQRVGNVVRVTVDFSGTFVLVER